VQRLRHALQHTQARLLEAATLAGLVQWPPDDWGSAWDQVAMVTTGALNELRDACRTIIDAADR
jgi:hypothetical protein